MYIKFYKSSTTLQYFISTTLSIVFLLNVWLFIDVEPFNIKSQVSTTFKMQILFLSYLVLITCFIHFLKALNQYKFILFLEVLISLIIGYIVASDVMSLSGAPLVSPVFGDVRRYFELVHMYNTDLFNNDSLYPPLWFMFQSLISKGLNTNIFEVSKYLELITPIFLAHLIFKIFQKTFGSLVGSLITLSTVFTLVVWREMAVVATIPILIIIITDILKYSRIMNPRLFQLRFLFLGLFLGLIQSVYYSVFYFTFPGVVVYFLALLTLKKESRFRIFMLLLDVVIGFYFSFGFLVLRPLFQLNQSLFIISLLLIFTIKIGSFLFLKAQSTLILVIYTLSSLILFISFFRIKMFDDYMYDELLSRLIFDPNIDSFISLIIFLGLLAYSIDELFRFQYFANALILLFIFFLSANFLKYYSGSKLFNTDRVDLFPRADNIIYGSWRLILILLALAAFSKFFKINIRYFESQSSLTSPVLISLIILLTLYAQSNLFKYQVNNWPTSNEGRREAHEICISDTGYTFDNIEIQKLYDSYLDRRCNRRLNQKHLNNGATTYS
jgi:hypothetical protein